MARCGNDHALGRLINKRHMTIKELEALLIREVNYAISIVKKRSLYKECNEEARMRINQYIESELVRYVLCSRYFDEDILKRDLLVSDDTINSIITLAMTNNFSIFSSND
jgi:hypothetical protein